MNGQTISWIQILQVGGLAGVISALISGGVKEIFEHLERRRKARYLALRLALILENYYRACADRIYDIDLHIGSNGAAGNNFAGFPKLVAYPDDPIAWIYINQGVADEVLNLPAEIAAINDGINFNIGMDMDPDGADPDITLKPLYEMAFRSIALARKVRSKHKLSKTNRTAESEQQLRGHQEKFLKELRAREQNRSQLLNPSNDIT